MIVLVYDPYALDHTNNASIGFPIIWKPRNRHYDNNDTGYIGEDTGILDFHI